MAFSLKTLAEKSKRTVSMQIATSPAQKDAIVLPGTVSASAFFWWAPVAIFALAVAVRLFFNLCCAEHRIIDIGDGYLYLTTGNKLLALFAHTRTLSDALAQVGAYSGQPLDLLLTSTRLADRLLLDGPIYPLYLCMVQGLLGIPAGTTNFSIFTQPLSMMYSITDGLTCLWIYVIGCLAFNRRTAVVAGAAYALYPPAVINTANSFSEPFAAFCLTSFVALLFFVDSRNESPRRVPWFFWSALGAVAGATMLVRSAFVIMPAVLSFVLVVAKSWHSKGSLSASVFFRRLTPGLVACACGLSCVLIPYLLFSWWQTGKPSFVSRAPGYNLSIGNQLPSDSWVCYSPQAMIPDAGRALSNIAGDISHHPGEYCSLYLRKFIRVWGGAWNDYQHDFVLTPDWQDVWHQFILLSTVAGVWILLKRPYAAWTKPRMFACGLTLAALCLLHCLYVCFIPLSRYAFTAMPAAILLAAFAWSTLAEHNRRARFVAFASGVLALCAFGVFLPSFVPLLMIPGFSFFQARLLDAGLWLVVWLYICWSAAKLAPAGNTVPSRLFAAAVICGGIALFAQSSLGAPPSTEWSAALKSGGSVRRSIFVPRLPASAVCALVVDCSSDNVCPSFSTGINDKPYTGAWIPFLQSRLGERYDRFLEVLAIQSHASGIPMYSARQWWLLPIPRSLLVENARNNIMLTANTDGDTVFGDYIESRSKSRLLPSLYDYSYMKGFSTRQRGDCRLIDLPGPCVEYSSQYFNGKNWRTDDLADAPGRQTGDYRLFIGIWTADSAHSVDGYRMISLVDSPQTTQVSGSNPLSYEVTPWISLGLPSVRSGQSLVSSLSCELEGNRSIGSASIYVEWSGVMPDGRRVTVRPAWNPECVQTRNCWTKINLTDLLPSDVSVMHDVRARVIATPFHADLLFLRRGDALKRRLSVRNLSLKCLVVPIVKSASNWILY